MWLTCWYNTSVGISISNRYYATHKGNCDSITFEGHRQLYRHILGHRYNWHFPRRSERFCHLSWRGHLQRQPCCIKFRGISHNEFTTSYKRHVKRLTCYRRGRKGFATYSLLRSHYCSSFWKGTFHSYSYATKQLPFFRFRRPCLSKGYMHFRKGHLRSIGMYGRFEGSNSGSPECTLYYRYRKRRS